MKRKSLLPLMAMMMGAGLSGGTIASAASAPTPYVNHSQEMKATAPTLKNKKSRIVNEVGGIPLVGHYPDYGMSPKEYGIRFGHGNKQSRSNRLRLSHNAKLKRR